MASLTVNANRERTKNFFSPVRELSVSSQRRRQWRNSQNVRGAAMKDAPIVRRTNGQNYMMVVASVGRRLLGT